VLGMKANIDTGKGFLNDLKMISLIGTGFTLSKAVPEYIIDDIVTVSFSGVETFEESTKKREMLKQKEIKKDKVGCKTDICKRCRACRLHLNHTSKSLVN
jgi:hypothetical protein